MINVKKLVLAIISLTLISFVIPVSAQQVSVGTPATQTVEVEINENGNDDSNRSKTQHYQNLFVHKLKPIVIRDLKD